MNDELVKELAKDLKWSDNGITYRNQVTTNDYWDKKFNKLNIGYSERDKYKLAVAKYVKYLHDQELERLESSNQEDRRQMVLDIAKKHNLFKDFVSVSIKGEKSTSIYLKTEKGHSFIGLASEVSHKPDKLYTELLGLSRQDIIHNIYQTYEPIIREKVQKSLFSVFEYILSYATLLDLVESIQLDSQPAVALIEGYGGFCLRTIPFKEQKVTINDLVPKLQDFLNRTSNHEYMCAILWAHLIGHHVPYVIYLYGGGSNGKTTFVNFLGEIVGSDFYTTFQSGSDFSASGMYNKSIISIVENPKFHIMDNQTLKSISGNSRFTINYKYSTPFDAYITGLLIADSNTRPRLKADVNEFRRLRFFNIKEIKQDFNKIRSTKGVTQEYTSCTNEFLNYCKQQYDKLGNGHGSVSDWPNMKKTFEVLLDPKFRAKMEKFFEHHKNKLEFAPDLKMRIMKLKEMAIDYYSKDKDPDYLYLEEDVEKYIKNIKDVTISDDFEYFIGIGFGEPRKSNELELKAKLKDK